MPDLKGKKSRRLAKDLFEPVSPGSGTFQKKILPVLQNSYLDAESGSYFRYSGTHLVNNADLQREYQDFHAEKRQGGYTEEELEESFGFLLFDQQEKAKEVCENGLRVGHSECSILGNPSKGVYVWKHSDCLDHSSLHCGTSGFIAVLRLTRGRVKPVKESHPLSFTAPTNGFDCHVWEPFSNEPPAPNSFMPECMQYYLYELSPAGDRVAKRPRHVLPFALVEFSYREASPWPPLLRESSRSEGSGKREVEFLPGHDTAVHWHPWRGQLRIKSMIYYVALRSDTGAETPAPLPAALVVDRVMTVSALRNVLARSVFETRFSREDSLEGKCCSLYEMVTSLARDYSLALLTLELKRKELALVLQLDGCGLLVLLSSSNFMTYQDPLLGKTETLLALFVFLDSSVQKGVEIQRSRTSLSQKVLQILPGLNYAESEVEKCPPEQQESLCELVEQHLKTYATINQSGMPESLSNEAGWFQQYDIAETLNHCNSASKCGAVALQCLQAYLAKPEAYTLPVVGREDDACHCLAPLVKITSKVKPATSRRHSSKWTSKKKRASRPANLKSLGRGGVVGQGGGVVGQGGGVVGHGGGVVGHGGGVVGHGGGVVGQGGGVVGQGGGVEDHPVMAQPLPPRRKGFGYGLKPIITECGRMFVPHGSQIPPVDIASRAERRTAVTGWAKEMGSAGTLALPAETAVLPAPSTVSAHQPSTKTETADRQAPNFEMAVQRARSMYAATRLKMGLPVPFKKQLRSRITESTRENGLLNSECPTFQYSAMIGQLNAHRVCPGAPGGLYSCGMSPVPEQGSTGVGMPADALTLLADLALSSSNDSTPADLSPALESGPKARNGSPSKWPLPLRSPAPEGLLLAWDRVWVIRLDHSYSALHSCMPGLTGGPRRISLQDVVVASPSHQDPLGRDHSDRLKVTNSLHGSPAEAQRRKRGLKLTRDIAQVGETISVTRPWKDEYDFGQDSKYTNEVVVKAVTRALHGPWDFGIEETTEQTRLILHTWIGLFYSRSTTRFFQTDPNAPLLEGHRLGLRARKRSLDKEAPARDEVLDLSRASKKVADPPPPLSEVLDLSQARSEALDLSLACPPGCTQSFFLLVPVLPTRCNSLYAAPFPTAYSQFIGKEYRSSTDIMSDDGGEQRDDGSVWLEADGEENYDLGVRQPDQPLSDDESYAQMCERTASLRISKDAQFNGTHGIVTLMGDETLRSNCPSQSLDIERNRWTKRDSPYIQASRLSKVCCTTAEELQPINICHTATEVVQPMAACNHESKRTVRKRQDGSDFNRAEACTAVRDGSDFSKEDTCTEVHDGKDFSEEDTFAEVHDGSNFSKDEVCTEVHDGSNFSKDEVCTEVHDGSNFSKEDTCTEVHDGSDFSKEDTCTEVHDGCDFSKEDTCTEVHDGCDFSKEDTCTEVHDGSDFSEDACAELHNGSDFSKEGASTAVHDGSDFSMVEEFKRGYDGNDFILEEHKVVCDLTEMHDGSNGRGEEMPIAVFYGRRVSVTESRTACSNGDRSCKVIDLVESTGDDRSPTPTLEELPYELNLYPSYGQSGTPVSDCLQSAASGKRGYTPTWDELPGDCLSYRYDSFPVPTRDLFSGRVDSFNSNSEADSSACLPQSADIPCPGSMRTCSARPPSTLDEPFSCSTGNLNSSTSSEEATVCAQSKSTQTTQLFRLQGCDDLRRADEEGITRPKEEDLPQELSSWDLPCRNCETVGQSEPMAGIQSPTRSELNLGLGCSLVSEANSQDDSLLLSKDDSPISRSELANNGSKVTTEDAVEDHGGSDLLRSFDTVHTPSPHSELSEVYPSSSASDGTSSEGPTVLEDHQQNRLSSDSKDGNMMDLLNCSLVEAPNAGQRLSMQNSALCSDSPPGSGSSSKSTRPSAPGSVCGKHQIAGTSAPAGSLQHIDRSYKKSLSPASCRSLTPTKRLVDAGRSCGNQESRGGSDASLETDCGEMRWPVNVEESSDPADQHTAAEWSGEKYSLIEDEGGYSMFWDGESVSFRKLSYVTEDDVEGCPVSEYSSNEQEMEALDYSKAGLLNLCSDQSKGAARTWASFSTPSKGKDTAEREQLSYCRGGRKSARRNCVKEKEEGEGSAARPSIFTVLDWQGNRRTYENYPITKTLWNEPVRGAQNSSNGSSHLLSVLQKREEPQHTPPDLTQSSLDLQYLIFSEKMNQILKRYRPNAERRGSAHRYSWRKRSAAYADCVPCGSPLQYSGTQECISGEPISKRRLENYKHECLGRRAPESSRSYYPIVSNVPRHLGTLTCDSGFTEKCPAFSNIAVESTRLCQAMMNDVRSGQKPQHRPRRLPREGRTTRPHRSDSREQIKDGYDRGQHWDLNAANRLSCRAMFRFYILVTSTEAFFEQTKELLEAAGLESVEPDQFDLDGRSSASPLLIILRNQDIADHISRIPHLLELKRSPSVLFEGVDRPDDVLNLTYQELFREGGFAVCDTDTLGSFTLGELKRLLGRLEELSERSRWKWLLHYRDDRELREGARQSSEARRIKRFVDRCQEAGLAEVMPYHECDVISQTRPDYLSCLLRLQVQHVASRFPVFITDTPEDSFEESGILAMNLNTFSRVCLSLNSAAPVDF